MKRLIKPLETKKKKSQPREKVIQSHILAWLRSVGCSVDIITVSMYNRSGISDIVGCLPDGRFLSVEVKRQGGKATKLQDVWIDEKVRNNGVSIIAHSVDEVRILLEGYGYRLTSSAVH